MKSDSRVDNTWQDNFVLKRFYSSFTRKLLTGLISENIYNFLDQKNMPPKEQKDANIKNGDKGSVSDGWDDFLRPKGEHWKLAMARVDYRKTYDIVPHSRIIECLDFLQIAGNKSSSS